MLRKWNGFPENGMCSLQRSPRILVCNISNKLLHASAKAFREKRHYSLHQQQQLKYIFVRFQFAGV